MTDTPEKILGDALEESKEGYMVDMRNLHAESVTRKLTIENAFTKRRKVIWKEYWKVKEMKS